MYYSRIIINLFWLYIMALFLPQYFYFLLILRRGYDFIILTSFYDFVLVV